MGFQEIKWTITLLIFYYTVSQKKTNDIFRS